MLLLAPLLIIGGVVLLPNHSALAQEPQTIHPWLTGCPDYSCFLNYFCGDNGICEPCPNDGINVLEEDCRNLEFFPSMSYNSSRVDECLSSCVRQQEGESCSQDDSCEEGSFFCNFDDDEEESIIRTDDEVPRQGTCQECKTDISECLFDDSISSQFGIEDCLLCDIRVCVPLHFSVTQIDDEANITSSNALQGSPSSFASGPLVGCTNLIHDGETTCDNGADATGAVCLIDDHTRNTYYIGVVEKCTELGGVAVIFYGDYSPRTPNSEPWTGSLSYKPSSIPSVSIPYNDGMRLQESKLGTIAHINTSDVGDACIKRQFCSEEIPCLGSSAGQRCDFKFGGDEGFCRDCPVDDDGNPSPLSCFFSIEDWGEVTGQKAVESCAETCASSLTFPSCKFCPTDVTGFDFGVESNAERCDFCPENDILYPEREFPLFGEGIKCWQVQKFFQTVEVSSDSENCRLAKMMNHVCGCAGSGYAGASNETKQIVLAWLPRMMAILSFFGSSFIIYDTSKSQESRGRLLNQLLMGLSVYDIFGSCAYSLTTLPIPKDDPYGPIYGARGNDATCTAQGFFIQIGTISAYTNVSLAIYYLLVIKFGWSENRVKKKALALTPLSARARIGFCIRWYPLLWLFAPMVQQYRFVLARYPCCSCYWCRDIDYDNGLLGCLQERKGIRIVARGFEIRCPGCSISHQYVDKSILAILLVSHGFLPHMASVPGLAVRLGRGNFFYALRVYFNRWNDGSASRILELPCVRASTLLWSSLSRIQFGLDSFFFAIQRAFKEFFQCGEQ